MKIHLFKRGLPGSLRVRTACGCAVDPVEGFVGGERYFSAQNDNPDQCKQCRKVAERQVKNGKPI